MSKARIAAVLFYLAVFSFVGFCWYRVGKQHADRYYAAKLNSLSQSLAECSKGNAEGAESKMLLDGCVKVRDSLIKRTKRPASAVTVIDAGGHIWTPPQRWIIFADLFYGCGHVDGQGKEVYYPGCRTYSYRHYWNGAHWTPARDDAKVYDHEPTRIEQPNGQDARDVVQIKNLETGEIFP